MSPHEFRRIALAHELLACEAGEGEESAPCEQADRDDTPAIAEEHDQAA